MKKSKDEFSCQLPALVIPILIQNLLSAAVSSADVVMLNYVGQSSVAAVSLAANYTNILFAIYYGLGSGVIMLCAQYYGKKEFKAIGAVLGIALRFSMLVSFVFFLGAFLVPKPMMKVFTSDEQLITLGASYLKVLCVSFLCWGITEVYLAALRSVGRVTVCTVLNGATFGLNIFLNGVFIFGWFGCPKFGITGVAIATSLSRVLQLIACFILSAFSKDVKLNFADLFGKNKILTGDFVRLALPAVGNDMVWGVAVSAYSAIIGHLGSDAAAANSFVMVVRNLGKILCLGIAGGGGILLGRILGENRMEEAKKGAGRIVKLSVIAGIIGGCFVLLSIPFVMSYASISLSETALGYLKWMLLMNVPYLVGTALNIGLNDGVFRSGGDSRFGFICDSAIMWGYAVPMGFLAAFAFRWPVLLVYFVLCTDEFVKWPLVIGHYRSRKWLKNITRDNWR